MRPISINAARQIGKKSGADVLVILSLDHQDRYCITTWGKTARECRNLANWAESAKALAVLRSIAIAALEADAVVWSGGFISTAFDPDALDLDKIGVE